MAQFDLCMIHALPVIFHAQFYLQFNMLHGIAYLQSFAILCLISSSLGPVRQKVMLIASPIYGCHMLPSEALKWCVCRRSSFPFVFASESVSASEPGRIRLFHLPLFDLPL